MNGAVLMSRLRMRRVLATIVFLAIVLSTIAWTLVRRASAHRPAGVNIRVNVCSSAHKYGCQLYYLQIRDSPYGQYYEAIHIHNCTDKAGDGTSWRVPYQKINFTYGGEVKFLYQHDSPHTSRWCGQSPIHTFNPGSGDQWWAYRGNNAFSIKTIASYPGYTMTCSNTLANFSSSQDYEDGNASLC